MISDRQSIISDYKFANNLAQPIQHTKRKKTMIRKKTQKIAKVQETDKGFYFNIQVIRKVATFLENIKSSIVRQKTQLQPLQAYYLQNEETQDDSSKNLISWQNPFLLAFQFIVLVFCGIMLWMNSYQIVFGTIEELNYIINSVFLGLYLTYIIIYLNTQYKNQKLEIIDSRNIIIKQYLNHQFPYDLIILVAIILQMIHMNWSFYPSHIMMMFVINLFMTLMTKFQNKFAVSIQVESIISIFKLLFKIIIFIHFLTLIFNAMSKLERQKGIDYTWVQKNNFSRSNNFQLYVYGWYWASTIISTVGFGDITPANVYQCGFISFVQLLCSVMLGYSVNYIGTMIGVFGQSKQTYQKDIRRLNKYLKTLTIPQKLQNSIRSHFFNKYQIDQVYDPQSEQYLFMKFTQKLRTEVKQSNNLNIIKKSKLLEIFSEQTLQNLAGVMKKAVYAPSQFLFDETTQNLKLFIIQEGNVNQLPTINKYDKKEKSIFKYGNQEENTIGWMNIITGNKYQSCTKAITYTITYQITRQQFIKVLKKHNKDFSKFHEIKQKMSQKPINFIKNCLVCGRLTHNAVNCPKIHFIPKNINSLLLRESKLSPIKINKRNKNCRRDCNPKTTHFPKQADFINESQQTQTNKIMTNKGLTSIKKSEASLNKLLSRKKIQFQLVKRLSLQKKFVNQANNHQQEFPIKKGTNNYNKYAAYFTNMKKISQECEGRTTIPIDNQNEDLYNTTESNSHMGLRNIVLDRLDKIMLQENQQFYPQFNISQILKDFKFNFQNSNLSSKLKIQYDSVKLNPFS